MFLRFVYIFFLSNLIVLLFELYKFSASLNLKLNI